MNTNSSSDTSQTNVNQLQFKTDATRKRKISELASDECSPDSEEIEQSFCKQMEYVVEGISAPFCCGSRIEAKDAIKINVVEGKQKVTLQPSSERYNRWNKPKAEQYAEECKLLQPVISAAPNASFGNGHETVCDKSVRDALQLQADAFDTNIAQTSLDAILSTIKKKLLLKTDIIAEAYSLNIYQTGGKFKKHKDTPRGTDMLGTLVVCLPTLFEGGALKVSLGTKRHKYFASYPSGMHGKCLRWCAFFADVDHEITTVTKGVRITVAYLLRRKDNQSAASSIPKEIVGPMQSIRVREEFSSAFQNKHFLCDGGVIGIQCVHLYTNREVFPGKTSSADALSKKQIDKLKGRDAIMAHAAAAVGCTVRLEPFVEHDYSADCDESGFYVMSKFPRKKKLPRRMSDDSIMSFFNAEQTDLRSRADLWIDKHGKEASLEVGYSEWNAECYGNEASGTNFYVKAALFIDVPCYEDRTTDVKPSDGPARKKRKTKTKDME